MKSVRKIVLINEEKCDGCGQCIISCAEGALRIVDGKAKLVADLYCDGLGACLGGCPQNAIAIVEREADEFDEEAVEHHLKNLKKEEAKPMACGCPSSTLQVLKTPCEQANQPVSNNGGASALSHWPVQIKLVPPTAPFLKGAHLLVAADCTPVAYPNFHKDFLQGKAVMIGCPKFDNTDEYFQKFTEIFKTSGVKEVTVLSMEVPCCSRLPMVVKEALKASGANIPLEEVIIRTRGEAVGR